MATETLERPREMLVDDAGQASAPKPADDRLHLTDLRIQGFRCFEDLTINRLGRVNLIAGLNGIGKSTLLDAVRVYAERGSASALMRTLAGRDELDEDQDKGSSTREGVDWSALFFGRELDDSRLISIGPSNDLRRLFIKPVFRELLDNHDADGLDMGPVDEIPTHLQLSINGRRRYINISARGSARLRRYASILDPWATRDPSRRSDRVDEFPDAIVCGSQGPDVISNSDLADLLDEFALTNSVQIATELVRAVVNRVVIAAAAVGGRRRSTRPSRVLVRLAGADRPMPLRSLGDGAVRAFGYALALANVSGGILLIDEIENGIHYTALPRFWRMLFEASRDLDVQIFATTHSFDCFRAFAGVVEEFGFDDAAYMRIDTTRITKRERVVEYSIDNMIVAAKYGVEVR